MNTLSAAKIGPWLLIAATALMILFSLEFPRILGWFPFLLGLGAIIYCRFSLDERPEIPKKLAFSLISIMALASISVTWSAFAPELYDKVLKITGIFMGGFILYTGFSNLKLQNHPALLLLPLAAGATMFLCCLELALDLQLYRLSHDAIGDLYTNTSVMNRGIVFMVLLFFPMITIIRSSALQTPKKKYAELIYWALMLVMLALTQSQSAQLAFFMGVLTYFAFPYKQKIAYKTLAVLIAIAIITAPFLVKFMFDAVVMDINSVPWIKNGYAAERLEIWNFISSYALQSPIYGHGILATRFIEDFEAGQLFYESTSVLHPHNFAVQIWIEFGSLGALLAAALFAFYISTINKEKPEDTRLILTVFISTLSIMAVGYGMWQSWWLGMLFFIASLVAMINSSQQNQHPKSTIT